MQTAEKARIVHDPGFFVGRRQGILAVFPSNHFLIISPYTELDRAMSSGASQLSIRARLLALMGGFAVMALIITALGLSTITDYNRMMRDYDHAYQNAWRGERLNRLMSNVVMETRGLYIARDDAELKGFVASLHRNLDDMETLLAEWKTDLTAEDASRLAPVESEAKAFIAIRRSMAQSAANGDVASALHMSNTTRSGRIAFQHKVDGIVMQTIRELADAKQRAEHYDKKRAGDFLITCLIGIGLMLGLSTWMVARFITLPLRKLASAIIKTSRGDYSLPLEARTDTADARDEVSSVWQALAILKERALEAERLASLQRESERQAELKLRELVLD
jgi:methyl-accepting chemotaxis protein